MDSVSDRVVVNARVLALSKSVGQLRIMNGIVVALLLGMAVFVIARELRGDQRRIEARSVTIVDDYGNTAIHLGALGRTGLLSVYGLDGKPGIAMFGGSMTVSGIGTPKAVEIAVSDLGGGIVKLFSGREIPCIALGASSEGLGIITLGGSPDGDHLYMGATAEGEGYLRVSSRGESRASIGAANDAGQLYLNGPGGRDLVTAGISNMQTGMVVVYDPSGRERRGLLTTRP